MRTRKMKAVVALAAAAGGLWTIAGAGTAHAQCSVQRHNLPDFDQVRAGLPNTGNNHCVPTAAINLLAYIANYGWPPMMLQSGPQNWQQQHHHAFITSNILLMGLLMNTDPNNGTTGDNGRAGLNALMRSRAGHLFTASNMHGEISPMGLYLHMSAGNLVNVSYGRYAPLMNNPNRFVRTGGHCVTLSGVFDACGVNPRIRYRDPATSEGDNTTQSTFSTTLTGLVRQTFLDSGGSSMTRWRLAHVRPNENVRRYLDGRYVITPMFALTASPTRSGELLTLRPVRLPGAGLPEETSVAIPDGGAITGLALLPDGIEAIVTSVSPGPVPQHRLWRYVLPTGEFTQALFCTGPIAATTSRFGEVYAACPDGLRRMQLHEGGDTSILQHAEVLQDFHFLVYDDARDEVVGVSTGNRLVRYTHRLDLVQDSALPAVQLPGRITLAIDEAAQRYFLAGDDGPTILELAPADQGPMQLISQITLPAVQRVTAMQFNDAGHLVVVHNGGIAEFARDDAGGWAPVADSPLAGLPARGPLVIPRSRTDFIAGVHDTPEWHQVLEDEGNEERPECRADWDVSGDVNSRDISAFISTWLTSIHDASPAADFNEDGTVNSTDISAFIAAWLQDVTQGCW